MIKPTGETYTYHYNGIGSTIAVTDQGKNVVNKYSYTPFGVLTNFEEAIPQPFKYAGQYGVMYEPGGLYYMRARYYDADTGRFISEDPIGFEGGINLYAYCNSNPVNFVDPLGLCRRSGWTNFALPFIGCAITGLIADDATVIGIADDALIPVLVAAGVGVAIIQATRGPSPEPYPGANKGKYINELQRQIPTPASPQSNPLPPEPPKGWWQETLEKLADVLDELQQ